MLVGYIMGTLKIVNDFANVFTIEMEDDKNMKYVQSPCGMERGNPGINQKVGLFGVVSFIDCDTLAIAVIIVSIPNY